MYKLELVNKKTKEVTIFDDIVDLNYGGKMFFNFEIDARQLADGEYALSLYENGELILTDTLCVGDFDIIGIQYKKGEAIYIETKLEAKIQDKTVEITDINTTILPDEEYDAMGTVEVNAQPVYDGAYNVGHTDGVRAQKDKLQSIEITANGVYSKEDGYNNIEVALPIQTGKVADIRKNGTFVITPDDDNLAIEQVTVNVEAQGQIRLPNGISFAGSTFTDFPVEDYDWSSLGSTILMFKDCKNLNVEPIIKALKDGTIPALHTRFMFYGSKVTRIEDFDFTKFYDCQGMFGNIIDLEEVRNCKFKTNEAYSHYTIVPTGKRCRVIDCEVEGSFGGFVNGWYFAKFKKADKLTSLVSSDKDCVAVMECDKPSTLTNLDGKDIWYDATKYSGWDSYSKSHPYGFYYNVITKDTNTDTNIMIKSAVEKVDYEQVIPYSEEKGCYYIDYPEYMKFNVYLDGVKLDYFTDKYNVDIYKPSNEPGVYEGSDIKYLIYHWLNYDNYEVKEDGLFVKVNSGNANVYQCINTPTDQLIITVTGGPNHNLNYLGVSKNGVSTTYNLYVDEIELTIDTSDCDFIEVRLYVKDYNKTYINKIEVL